MKLGFNVPTSKFAEVEIKETTKETLSDLLPHHALHGNNTKMRCIGHEATQYETVSLLVHWEMDRW